jgi:hypothetical protein
MESERLVSRFARMGARLKVQERADRERGEAAANVAVEVQRDRLGEYFEIRVRPSTALRLEVVDVQPAVRHLLLQAEVGDQKLRFLCGHDERQWFVAAVPEQKSAASVRTAMEAVKPAEGWHAPDQPKAETKDRERRKTGALVRQGEWCFLPEPELMVEEWRVSHNTPLSRGVGSEPHIAEFCYRSGGEVVHVCDQHPRGIGDAAYAQLLESNPEARNWTWRLMRRNPHVYVKGRIRHADHKTIVLPCWHRVVIDPERESWPMWNVVFLD